MYRRIRCGILRATLAVSCQQLTGQQSENKTSHMKRATAANLRFAHQTGGLAHSSVHAFVALTIAPNLPLTIKPHIQVMASTPSGMRPIGVERGCHYTSAEHRNQRYLG
jgi:hypothetical protein